MLVLRPPRPDDAHPRRQGGQAALRACVRDDGRFANQSSSGIIWDWMETVVPTVSALLSSMMLGQLTGCLLVPNLNSRGSAGGVIMEYDYLTSRLGLRAIDSTLLIEEKMSRLAYMIRLI